MLRISSFRLCVLFSCVESVGQTERLGKEDPNKDNVDEVHYYGTVKDSY